ncbi:TetR/AcrR family transcriptional regulator [Clostridium sp. NSJ-6]|uniref:TetR/AcrR family transcriptional regulator n=1 Tax=Clostridium hominis TaxID=2763036 RepID=A0ABR7D8K3_9CLOT|nr:TetR/AcrR family transcriptional regulator [Clostridium hominis]MBC5627716.1 TetR/AcrR family transcriptional regulator [Clostridium hominis]MDU2673026.1 TetR/AcrR family transcriptional regulator [Clostridium sp.]
MSDKDIQNAEVKEKIIKAAIEEFAENGYKAASTNSICKKAKVSKGLIYYYFKSKEEIYLNALKFAIDEFKENVTIQINDNSKNGINYISEYFDTKFKFFRENPLYSKLIINSLLNDNTEEAKKLGEEFQRYNNSLIFEIIKSIDINPKFNREKAFELVLMIGEKLEEKHMKDIENKQKDTAIEEFRKDHKLMIEMVFEGIDK